jgi:hypothetical protein
VLMFGLALLYILESTVTKIGSKNQLIILASLVLGAYSVPTFIYLSIPVILFYLLSFYKKNKENALILLKITCLALIVILGLYAPVFLVSGNYNFMRQYTPVSWVRIPELILKLYRLIFDFSFGYSKINYFFLLLAGIGLVSGLSFKKNKSFYFLSFFIFLIPFFSFILQRQYFPPRIFIHFIIFTSLIIGSVFSQIKKEVLFTMLLVVFYPAYLYNASVRNPRFIKYDKMDAAARIISGDIIKNRRKSVYFHEAYPKPLIEFYTRIKKKEVRLYNGQGLWKKDSFDINYPYDVIVWPSNGANLGSIRYITDTIYADETILVTGKGIN